MSKPITYARVYCDEPNPRLHRAACNWSCLMLQEAYRAARGAAQSPFWLWRYIRETWNHPAPPEVTKADRIGSYIVTWSIIGVIALTCFLLWESSRVSPESSYSHVVVEVGSE